MAWLPELHFTGGESPVLQVIAEATGEILYTVRVQGAKFQPPVFEAGKYTIKVGRNRPDGMTYSGIEAGERGSAAARDVSLSPQ